MRGTLTHDEFIGTRRFTSLDGLRGISVLLVFTAHPAYGEFWPMFHGQAGVTIFFVLSGFLITTLLLREEDRYGKIDVGGFFIRRLFRIYPMFFLVFFLYCILIFGLGMQADRRDAFAENIPYFLLLFPEHSMFFNDSGVAVPFNMTWSVGIEEKFYLLWPILGFVLLAGFRRTRPWVLVGLAGLFSALSFLPEWGAALAPYTHIVFGALVATLLHAPRGYALLSNAGRWPVLLGATVVAAIIQFGTGQVLESLYIVYGTVIALLVAGLVTTKSRGAKALEGRFLVYTGALSYILYLIHNFGLNAAESIIPGSWGLPGSIVSTVLGIAAAYAGAAVLHKYFEEPVRQYGARLAKRRRLAQTERLAGADPQISDENRDTVNS